MTSTPPSRLPNPGDLLVGKYRIDRVLGRGGMGVVYAARHELLGQLVAIKLLLVEGTARADASARFLQEARAAARIQHDNIARVSDVGSLEDGTPYMVMEYLDGRDLSQLLEASGALPVQAAVDYVLQALEAVAQAHALGIVHRDLKPANLFLSKRPDGSSLVKVLDFGISKSDTPLHAGAQTSTQAMLGSPYYMSPEQLRSSKGVDRRSDIWSVGVILYELLTRSLPFSAETLGGLFAAILEQTPTPPSTMRPDVPRGLDVVILKCLSRAPDARFANAAELAWALLPFASPRGAASAERISGLALASSQNTSRPSLPDAPAMIAPPAHGQTAAAWQQSGSGAKPATRRSVGVFVAAGVALAAVVGVGLFAASRLGPAATTGAAATAPTPSTADSATAVAPPAPAPSASTAAEAKAPPSESASAAPAAATAPDASPSAAVAAPPAPAPWKKATRAPAPAPPPAATSKRNCNPPFTVDANGAKHAKPECL